MIEAQNVHNVSSVAQFVEGPKAKMMVPINVYVLAFIRHHAANANVHHYYYRTTCNKLSSS